MPSIDGPNTMPSIRYEVMDGTLTLLNTYEVILANINERSMYVKKSLLVNPPRV